MSTTTSPPPWHSSTWWGARCLRGAGQRAGGRCHLPDHPLDQPRVRAHLGRVFLGDGVMASFPSGSLAVEAAVFMQQSHTERILKWPEPLRMGLKIGMASDQIVEMGNDTYGDPVNLAARLSDMAGSDAIWIDESAMTEIRADRLAAERGAAGVAALQKRALPLAECCACGAWRRPSVFQVEWNEEVSTDLMTVQGALQAERRFRPQGRQPCAGVWSTIKVVAAHELPLTIGHMPDSGFVVSGRRCIAPARQDRMGGRRLRC